MDTGRVTVFPDFVRERSPERLRRAMFDNNVEHGVQFVYSNIQFVDGEWYAWFHVEVRTQDLIDLLSKTGGADPLKVVE